MARSHLVARGLALLALTALLGPAAGCSSDDGASPPEVVPGPSAPELREELLEMMAADQLERTGEGLPPGTKLPPIRDHSRTVRLQEIIAEVGWPTFDLVGEDGATAAWLIAQHSDTDVEFQVTAVELLRAAVDDGQADATELAYLEDRVAVNRGQPQTYGTQIRCRGGEPDPATPLADEVRVEELRASVGLGTLADYYDELAMMCADEAAEGAEPIG